MRLYCDNRLAELQLDSELPPAYVGDCKSRHRWLHVRDEAVVAGDSPTSLEPPIPGLFMGTRRAYWGIRGMPSFEELPAAKLGRAIQLELHGKLEEASKVYRFLFENTPRNSTTLRSGLAARALELDFWHQQRACLRTSVADVTRLVVDYRKHLRFGIDGQRMPLRYVQDRLFRTKLRLLVPRRFRRVYGQLRWQLYQALTKQPDKVLQPALPDSPALTSFTRRRLRSSGALEAVPLRSPLGFVRPLSRIVGQRRAVLAIGTCETFDRGVRARLFRLTVNNGSDWMVLPVAITPCRIRGLYSGGHELLAAAKVTAPVLVELVSGAREVRRRLTWTVGAIAALAPMSGKRLELLQQTLRTELTGGPCATRTVDRVERSLGLFAAEHLLETIREHRGTGSRIRP